MQDVWESLLHSVLLATYGPFIRLQYSDKLTKKCCSFTSSVGAWGKPIWRAKRVWQVQEETLAAKVNVWHFTNGFSVTGGRMGEISTDVCVDAGCLRPQLMLGFWCWIRGFTKIKPGAWRGFWSEKVLVSLVRVQVILPLVTATGTQRMAPDVALSNKGDSN